MHGLCGRTFSKTATILQRHEVAITPWHHLSINTTIKRKWLQEWIANFVGWEIHMQSGEADWGFTDRCSVLKKSLCTKMNAFPPKQSVWPRCTEAHLLFFNDQSRLCYTRQDIRGKTRAFARYTNISWNFFGEKSDFFCRTQRSAELTSMHRIWLQTSKVSRCYQQVCRLLDN
jgi:hypothetical protein